MSPRALPHLPAIVSLRGWGRNLLQTSGPARFLGPIAALGLVLQPASTRAEPSGATRTLETPGRSEGAPGALPPLPPLSQVLKRVSDSAPEMRAARAAVNTAQSTMVGARRPSFGNPYLTVFAEHGPGVTADVFIDGQLELPVEVWAQRRRRIAESAALGRLSNASLEVIRATTLANAVESYAQIVLSHERTQVLAETIDIASSEAELYQARMALGDATERDARVAELEVARNQVLLIEARADFELSRGTLHRLTGEKFGAPTEPMAKPPWALAKLDKVQGELPSVLESSREAEYYDASKARSRQEARAPVSVLLRAGRGDLAEGRLGGGFAVGFPVFQKNQGDIARADANAAQARIVAEATETALRAQLEAALAELSELEQAVKVLDEVALPAAAAAVRASEEIHRAGKSDLLPVLISRRDYAALRLRRLDILGRSWSTLARIIRWKGTEL